MKKKEKSAYFDMKTQELQKHAADLEQKVTMILLTSQTKQAKNSRESRILKRKIAVIQTLMRKKELEHEKQ